MKKLITVIVGVITVVASAQSTKEIAYGAYLTASKTMWEKSVAQAVEEHGEESFERALALYGLLNNTMASQDEKTFNKYKGETIDLLEELIEEKPNWGEPKAVLSSTYGLVMAYSPMKGMFLGMKSSSLMDEALKQQPESALIQKLYAGSKLYTPEMFGGDPEEAVNFFTSAIEAYRKGSVENDWLYLDTMMGLSMAYRKVGQQEKAVEILQEAIKIEPKYYWAKSQLEKITKS